MPEHAEPQPTITPCPNGPLLIRGNVHLTTVTGEAIERPDGTIALCRCGHSATKPFCDGSHKRTRFSAD